MKIIFWGNGNRGKNCLEALNNEGYEIPLVVCHTGPSIVRDSADALGIETISPQNPNEAEVQKYLQQFDADLFVLAAYGKILKQQTIDIPKLMCLNLHGGRLPEYRGSSPMNWVLINGEDSFGLSIIKVDSGVDTGDVLAERSFEVSINDTICDLHNIANEQFPLMLLEAIEKIEQGGYEFKRQDNSSASYFPLRFPDDGLIFWDTLSAEQIHNRIRALTEPYPCAFTFYKGREVKLLKSALCEERFFGEAGRVYRKKDKELLVCASDRCLWLKEAEFKDTNKPLYESVARYDKLTTTKDVLMNAVRAGILG
ncbi:MAG TPA: methionyl-tRNA formyltransferase [Planctomycetes bacterium]|nr:methionyl-tRNA formyltransferase [Planctomycetota bacterium]